MKQAAEINTINKIKKYAIFMLVAWSLVIGASMGWNYVQKKEGAILSASEAARTQFSMDVLNRRWSAGHGGVYVPVSESTQPNPYLDNVIDRDIKTPSGKLLTLVNPAYMTRQVHELGLETSHIRGHITSLNPIRKENFADKWETKALKSFEKNVKEVASVEILNGVAHLRLMRPLITEKGCMKCHEQQGYKVGDIRGGISSSVPMEPYLTIANSEIFNLALWHGVLWLFGVLFLGVASKEIVSNAKEREELHTQLRVTDERLKLAIEGTREGIWDWYIQTGVTYFNKRSAEIIGYSLEELEPQNIQTWNNNIHPDDLEKSNELLERLFSGEIEFYEFESRMKHKNGEWVWVLHRGNVVEWDNEGKPIRMTGTHSNISERKQAEEELAEYIEELYEAREAMEQNAGDLAILNIKLEESEAELIGLNANKDKFFSIISHDLKSPFSGLLGITEILTDDYDDFDDVERKELLDGLNFSTKKIYELLEGLLEWSQMQRGAIDFNPKQIDVSTIGKSVVELLQINAEKKEIELKCDINENKFVFADENMVNTVVRNLFANAIKFTSNGGSVKMYNESDGDFNKIIIEDNGIGMNEESINKLFRIEIHHTSVGTNNEPGTGVGLILCKELVEKNNGKIWVESELGKGSKFIFTLPKSSNS